MPIINIKLAKPLPSDEKLAELAGKITDLMVQELGKNPARVVVNFEGVEPAHIAFGGVTVAAMSAAAAAQPAAKTEQTAAAKTEQTPAKWCKEGAGELVRIGVVVASDRASSGDYEDRGGPGVWQAFAARCANPLEGHYRCVADERGAIAAAIAELAGFCDVVATTGGTGPAARDVTPEATRDVCDRELAGFGELMRAASLRAVPTAILSRQTAAVCGRALVINLPGKPAAIEDCLAPIWPALGYAVDLIGGARIEAAAGAEPLFRPKGK